MIIQQNIFICEECGRTEIVSTKVDVWRDPIVNPPQGSSWCYGIRHGKEVLFCGKCNATGDPLVKNY